MKGHVMFMDGWWFYTHCGMVGKGDSVMSAHADWTTKVQQTYNRASYDPYRAASYGGGLWETLFGTTN